MVGIFYQIGGITSKNSGIKGDLRVTCPECNHYFNGTLKSKIQILK